MAKSAAETRSTFWGEELFRLAWFSEQVQSMKNFPHPPGGQCTDLFTQLCFIDGENLGDIDHTRLGKVCFSQFEEHISRSLGALEIGS